MLVIGACRVGLACSGANGPENASRARGSVDGESCFVVVTLGVMVLLFGRVSYGLTCLLAVSPWGGVRGLTPPSDCYYCYLLLLCCRYHCHDNHHDYVHIAHPTLHFMDFFSRFACASICSRQTGKLCLVLSPSKQAVKIHHVVTYESQRIPCAAW